MESVFTPREAGEPWEEDRGRVSRVFYLVARPAAWAILGLGEMGTEKIPGWVWSAGESSEWGLTSRTRRTRT